MARTDWKKNLAEFQKRAKTPKRYSTRGSAFSTSRVIASRVEENLPKMGPPLEPKVDLQDTLLESYLTATSDDWYGTLRGLTNGQPKMNWYSQYQQMPPSAGAVERFATIIRNMPPLDPARIRQLARLPNFGTIMRYEPPRVVPAMTYYETFERESDASAALSWIWSCFRGAGLDKLIAIVKAIVRAWASDVVTDTMRRYSQLDLTPSRELKQLAGEVAMDERTSNLEIEDRKLQVQEPDWTAANTRASLLELA